MKPIFSIIVPVYNVEKYLYRCILSIVQQQVEKEYIEVLLIDDGSTDSSSSLCDKIALEYNYIKVYHKANGGLSDARNYGLDKAVGDYIIFLDSDDYLAKDALSYLKSTIEKFHNIDIIAITTNIIINDSSNIIKHHSTFNQVISGKEYLKNELSKKMFFTAWSSVYKREFLLQNNLRFKKGILHEDEEFTPRAFLLANSVVNTDYPFYEYVIRDNSITTKKDKLNNAQSIFNISEDLYKLYIHIDDNILKMLLLTHNAKICYQAFEFGRLYQRDRRQYINYKLLKQCSLQKLERIKYHLLIIHPYILHLFNKMFSK